MTSIAGQISARLRSTTGVNRTVRRRFYDSLPVRGRAVVRRVIQGDPLFPRQPHTISVIVPVYNVEEYLHECLRSIANQAYTNLQIIIVDDGSTDDSLAIAEHFAKTDSRVKIITQANAGLGAARNTGLKVATGDFVVFSDSDDIVPPNAYKVMIETLLQSGSDFVVGSYWRMTELRQYVPKWVKDAHAEPIIGATSKDFLLGLANVFAWNKMFRSDFIERTGLVFPEGIRYEDQLPITKAYLSARAFDVIPDKVYKWRIRFDGSSITQNKGSYEDVSDRAEVITSVYDYVNNNADAEFRDYWIAKVLGMDLIPYISESLHAEVAYRERIRYLIGLLEPHVTDDVLSKIKVRARCALYTFKHGSTEELGHVMLTNSEIGPHLPTEARGDGELYFSPDYPEEVSTEFPDDCLRLTRDELSVEHAISRIRWTDGRLQFDGWAFFRNVNLDDVDGLKTQVYLESDVNSRRVDLNVAPGSDFVSRSVKSKWPNYDRSAFTADVTVDELVRVASEHDVLRLYISIEQLGMTETLLVTKLITNGSAGRLEAMTSDEGVIIQPSLSKKSGLKFALTQAATVVESIQPKGDAIDLSVRTSLGKTAVLSGMSLQTLRKRKQLSQSTYKRQARFSVSSSPFAVRALPQKGSLRLQNGWTSNRLFVTESALPDDAVFVGGKGVRRTRRSTLEVLRRGLVGYIHSVSLDGLELVIHGSALVGEQGEIEVVLKSKRMNLAAETVEFTENQFTARFTLQTEEFGQLRNLPYGGYLVTMRQGQSSLALLPGRTLGRELPTDAAGDRYRLRLTKTRRGAMWLTFGFASTDEETGTLNQAELQRWHREGDFEPLADSVFFQSYLGEQATDSALAIHRELHRRKPEMNLYWGVIDDSVQLPDGAIPIVMYTREWYETLSRAEYLVNNIYFFSWFGKRPFQTYLQTWHGTPLKKIGRSYWEDRNREPVWIERMDRQAADWDYLVSPNAFCTAKFSEEFRYMGQVLEVGYPRNDALSAPSSQNHDETRAVLGISESKKVVLYAPTWRDSQSAKAWVANMVTFIDLQRLSHELGDDYVILVRGHGHNARAGSTVGSEGNVIDVTYYPEINDLYLIADLAITDYSSVMFDFAVTRKPMLFFVPDLEVYAEGVRGFYLDYESTVPGPIVRDPDRIAGEIQNLMLPTWAPSDRYRSFLQEFCSNEDGYAAQRVVDQVWDR